MKNKNSRVLFLSHGGGPLPLLGDVGHQEMIKNLRHIAAEIKKPSAVLVISAHWEEKIPSITSAARPSLIYDYYGFPQVSYEIQYPCPGEPELAEQVHLCLSEAGIESQLDAQRGFDHGLFVPLKIMYPEADIPCIEVSLVQGLDPAEHIKLGEALSGIDYENLLIIGSGLTFHNLKEFFIPSTDESRAKNEAFEQWLIDTCSNTEISEEQRIQRFNNWLQAPYARYCHPREEHLLPLHVCYGVTGTACQYHYELNILNKKASAYLW